MTVLEQAMKETFLNSVAVSSMVQNLLETLSLLRLGELFSLNGRNILNMLHV